MAKSWMLCAIVGLFLGVMASQAPAADEDMAAKLKQLEQRLNQQDKVIGDLRGELADTKKAAMSREDMVKLAKELDANSKEHSLPGWLDNLKFYGDLRLRYQGEDYNWGNGDSEKKNRNRARFRLRFGLVKTWLEDQLEVGFRLASGDSETATSTNQTFTDGFSDKKVWIDLAYARYSPKQVPGLSVIGGKMKSPWLMNEIFLDSDVNPEGVWAEYKPPCPGPVQPFAGVGYFIFREASTTSGNGFDTIVFGPQAGLTWKINKDYAWTTAAYYQDWDHYDEIGDSSANGNDSPLSRIPGFGVIGLTNSLDFKVCKLPVKVFLDWARNCEEADSTENYEDDNNAYAVGVQVGKNKKKGDWSLKYVYAYVQANSLPGAIADADFGSANRQGHKVGGEYNLLDNLTLGVTLLWTQPIFSPTTTSGSATEDDTVTVQADLVWKF